VVGGGHAGGRKAFQRKDVAAANQNGEYKENLGGADEHWRLKPTMARDLRVVQRLRRANCCPLDDSTGAGFLSRLYSKPREMVAQ